MEILDPDSSLLVQTLVETYGFDLERSVQAVADTKATDLEAAIDWLLSHGEDDPGGAVALKHCSHLDSEAVSLVEAGSLRFGERCREGCATTECWVCLHCGGTYCSRYVNKHALCHFEATKAEPEGMLALGHMVAISLSDLHAWCYLCNSCTSPPSPPA